MSVPPPGDDGTMKRTGLAGHSCACASAVTAIARRKAAMRFICGFPYVEQLASCRDQLTPPEKRHRLFHAEEAAVLKTVALLRDVRWPSDRELAFAPAHRPYEERAFLEVQRGRFEMPRAKQRPQRGGESLARQERLAGNGLARFPAV